MPGNWGTQTDFYRSAPIVASSWRANARVSLVLRAFIDFLRRSLSSNFAMIMAIPLIRQFDRSCWNDKKSALAGCGKTVIHAGFGKGPTSVGPLSRRKCVGASAPEASFFDLDDFFRSLLG